MVVAGTAGARRSSPTRCSARARPTHVERRRQILGEVRKRFKTTTSWFSATVRYVSAGQDPRQDLGGDRQPLPGVRRLHLRLPGLHLLHRERPPGRARPSTSGCASGTPARWAASRAWPAASIRARPSTTAATAASSASWRTTSSSANCRWPASAAAAASRSATATSACPAWWRSVRRATAESERHEPAAHLRTSTCPSSRSWTGWSTRSPEVKTFYWHFEDPAEQAGSAFLPGPVRAGLALRRRRVPGLAAAQPDRGRDFLHHPPGGQLHRRPAPAEARRQVRACAAPTATASR